MSWAPTASEEALNIGWERGDLTLLKKPIQERTQRAWRDCNRNIFVVHISRQVGKSHLALLIAIEECLKQPDFRVVFVSHVEKRLQEYFRDLLNRCLSTCPAEMKPNYVNTSLQFSNGSEIVLASDANKSFFSQRGQRYNLIILDEFAFYHSPKELLWTVLYPTLTTTKGKILITTTSPETPAHYSNALFEKAALEGWYYKATIYDDETFTAEEVEDLKRGCLDEFAWSINYLCTLGIADRSKLIIPEFTDEYIKELDEKTPQFPHYFIHEGLDFGTADKTVNLYSKYMFDKSILYIQDETALEGKDVTTDRISEEIQKKEDKHYKGQKIYRRIADTDNVIARQTLAAQYGKSFLVVKKKQVKEMVDKVRRWMKGGRIIIHPRCKLLIATLKGGLWKNDERKDFGRTETLGHCDAIAALVYLIRHVDDATDSVPAFTDIEKRRVIISPKAKQIIEDKKHPWKRQLQDNFENILGLNDEDEGIL